MHLSLTPFGPSSYSVTGNITLKGSQLRCDWHVCGPIDAIVLPAPSEPVRVDELWKHTCFEWFIGPASEQDYVEFNLSPGGAWNAYRFTGEREGMQADPEVELISSETIAAATLVVGATIQVGERLTARQPWQIGMTAILERLDGESEWFALSHRSHRPDFHQRSIRVPFEEMS